MGVKSRKEETERKGKKKEEKRKGAGKGRKRTPNSHFWLRQATYAHAPCGWLVCAGVEPDVCDGCSS